MLLDLEDLVARYDMRVEGVVHCGAHLAEEAPLYQRLFPGRPVWWIEANDAVTPQINTVISAYPEQKLIQALLWHEDDVELPFHVTNYDGMSSSVLEFGSHPEFSPDTVFVEHRTLTSTRLDTIVEREQISGANLLNMDLQGVELNCLRGARGLVAEEIDYIISEVNTAEVYKGCSKLPDMDAYLATWGFKRVETSMVPDQGWGDALWLRR